MTRVLILAALLLVGCKSATEPCDERNVDLIMFDVPSLEYLTELTETGFDCVYDYDLRNAFGAFIGQRWVCTKCP